MRKLTVHDTPEHNGVAKCLNQTLLEKVRAMLHESSLPKFLWAEATAHAVYLKNQTWTHTLGDTTPYEILNSWKPNIANLQPWGCKFCVHETGGSKLDGCSKISWWMDGWVLMQKPKTDITFTGQKRDQSLAVGSRCKMVSDCRGVIWRIGFNRWGKLRHEVRGAKILL